MSFSDDLNHERAEILRAVRHASNAWADAMRAHTLAPPDADFANRLRALAQAAQTERVTWEHAHAAGLQWRPIPGAQNAEPPYELRPGSGRRGPTELWDRFDAAVGELNLAIAGNNAAAVADAFGEMESTAAALADAVASDDSSRAHARAQGAA